MSSGAATLTVGISRFEAACSPRRACGRQSKNTAWRQLVRFRVWPRASTTGVMGVASFAALAAAAGHDRAWAGATILLVVAVLLGGGIVEQCAAATAALLGPVLVQERAARLAASRAPASPAFAIERRARRTTAADRKVAAIEQAFSN